jgi:hypothetical protein
MPDFDARKPQERNDPNRVRIQSCANKLRTLLIATRPRIVLIANRVRNALIENRLRTLLIGGGILLLVVAVPVGLLMYSSSGMGDNPLSVKAANSKPLTGQCRGDYRTFGSVDYSPNGQKKVFVSYYNYDSDPSASASAAPGTSRDEADNEICVVNADGTGMVRLTDDSNDEYSAVWSPDGEKIAFIRYIWEESST